MSSSPAASSSPVAADVPPPRILLVAAFAALYVIWGSTYFGIAVAIETIPPFPMVGIRQLVAGVVLVAILRARGVAWPDRAHWTGAIVGGVLLLVLGNGLVAWAEQHIASGVASLVIATTPLSIMTIAALVPGGERPTARAVAGLLLGCAGLVVLAWPGAMAALRGEAAHGGIDAFGLVVLVFATICWATGTVLGRFLPRHANAFMASAQQMLVAGVVLLVTTMITGDLGRLDLGAISARSWLALGYLIAIG
ncbi:MAG: EamA family transporter, partial [Gemmatimonadaceae bacterium]|nr:EamA family transporter [Gemmatimonadaceae bacterium]